jgi:GntR family transcriptional regulator, transcriptional repressor for pyruvate dehydrogenase complex
MEVEMAGQRTPVAVVKKAAFAGKPKSVPARKPKPALAGRPKSAIDGNPDFKPVRMRRAFEVVCDQIRSQIAQGKLKPGDRLPGERELTEQFSVNRSVLREALRSLEMAGIVRAQPGSSGGLFICEGSSSGVTQALHDMLSLGQVSTASLAEARIVLTSHAIRLACERATAEDIEAIEADIARLELLAKQQVLSRHTAQLDIFYRLLASATHNEVVVMLVDALSQLVGHVLSRIDPAVSPGFISVRRSVLRSIKAKDAEKAVSVMSRHLRHLHEYIQSQSRAVITD